MQKEWFRGGGAPGLDRSLQQDGGDVTPDAVEVPKEESGTGSSSNGVVIQEDGTVISNASAGGRIPIVDLKKVSAYVKNSPEGKFDKPINVHTEDTISFILDTDVGVTKYVFIVSHQKAGTEYRIFNQLPQGKAFEVGTLDGRPLVAVLNDSTKTVDLFINEVVAKFEIVNIRPRITRHDVKFRNKNYLGAFEEGESRKIVKNPFYNFTVKSIDSTNSLDEIKVIDPGAVFRKFEINYGFYAEYSLANI